MDVVDAAGESEDDEEDEEKSGAEEGKQQNGEVSAAAGVFGFDIIVSKRLRYERIKVRAPNERERAAWVRALRTTKAALIHTGG